MCSPGDPGDFFLFPARLRKASFTYAAASATGQGAGQE